MIQRLKKITEGYNTSDYLFVFVTPLFRIDSMSYEYLDDAFMFLGATVWSYLVGLLICLGIKAIVEVFTKK